MIMKVSIYDDSYSSKPLIKAGSRVKFQEVGYNEWIYALVKDYNEYGITFTLTDGEEVEIEYNELTDVRIVKYEV